MKKIIIVLLLIIIYIFNNSLLTFAHSSELDFYKIFQNHGSIMLIINTETGEIVYANEAASIFYGYPIGQLESMKIQEINTLTPEKTEKEMQAAMEEKRNYFIFNHRLASGDIRTVEVYSYPYTYENKTMLVSIIHDITMKTILAEEHKEMTDTFLLLLSCMAGILLLISFLLYNNFKKMKLKNHEINNFNELRQTFIDADNSLIYLKDENLRYVFVNKAFQDFFNKEPSEIIGYDDYHISDEEFATFRRKTDLEMIEKKTLVVDEVTWGNSFFQTMKFPVKLLNDKYGVGAYIKDVTDEHDNKIKLETAHSTLMENEAKLQLILDSTAEAIYGIDTNGNCTFCNKSCLKLLKYKDQEELLGKNMHSQIHHSNKEGVLRTVHDCEVFKAFINGEGTHVDDEVLWRSDGTSFDAEYYSYPQYKDGKIIGAVVTFMDITNRKKAENEIIYLSYHDSLTGLYNRRFFEEELKRLDVERNLPISIIMGDINGLKLTNDIFGHAAGDLLVQKAAEAIKIGCRADDIIARWGGDEFIIILTKANNYETEVVAKRIKELLSKEYVKDLNCSISFGYDTKYSVNEDILLTIKNAEDKMYAEKILDHQLINNSKIEEIKKKLHEKSLREEKHSVRVSELCEKIGKALNLTEAEISTLKDAGFLHDIGKIVVDKSILNKSDPLTELEWQELKQHPVVGYRILNSTNETMDIAKYVLGHHEKWDGTGYPKGLEGEAISKYARIIALAESYDEMTNDTMYKQAMSKEEAIVEIEKNASLQFDPNIAKIMIQILKEEGK